MITVRNIYYMLAYAYETLNESSTRALATEPFAHVHDLFAAILARGVMYQIKRGLHRAYMPREEALPVLRGALDIGKTVRANRSGALTLVCRYDEFTEDNPFNRILKSTMRLLLTSKQVKDVNKHALRKALLYFGEVEIVPPADLRFTNIRYDRSNQTYRLLIAVCELVHKSLLQSRRTGGTLLRDFLDDKHMYALYERFVLNYYRHHYPKLRAAAEYVAWDLDEGSENAFLPAMKSDITLTCGQRKLIIDAKYYDHAMQHNPLFDKRSVRSGHLYQIFAYVKNKDVRHDGSVSGLLLYARTDETEAADGASYRMSGNRIGVRTLPLDGEWSRIVDTLNGIVSDWLIEL